MQDFNLNESDNSQIVLQKIYTLILFKVHE